MVKFGGWDLSHTLMGGLSSTPRRTFVLYPFLVASVEWLLRSGLYITGRVFPCWLGATSSTD
jgi:hypothetical protein